MLLNEILNEMTQGEVSYMNKELNSIYKPIGIEFVITKHVMDRVNNNDGREKSVSPEDIISAFKKLYNAHRDKFQAFIKSGKLDSRVEIVLHDKELELNIPFVFEKDKIHHRPVFVILTIMKLATDKFKSHGYEITV